ncbi:MAG: LysR family transcriptional regulator [Oscillospiraceae bacterium]|jgi:DNA-binding transcriptional LysR family regulator|nr:LysR family transcriptional regulator [Oscillospiraceae bacterium]
MDFISLYYFSEVAKDLNITKTAARLFISQQTLSNHIQRLEKHFGAELLHRRPAMALTTAGEFVLSFAGVVAKEHTNLRDILSDIEKQERGAIRFGASIMRGAAILPEILGPFYARYPNVDLCYADAVSSRLRPMVAQGELDFAVVLETEADPKLIYEHLINDQVYLCVSEQLLVERCGARSPEIKTRSLNGADMRDFAGLPFAMLTNYLGQQIQNLFYEADVAPIVRFSSANTKVAAPLCAQGLCACFLTHLTLADRLNHMPENVNIFPLLHGGRHMSQPFSLIRVKERYLSHYAKYFIELLTQYFNMLAPINIARSV